MLYNVDWSRRGSNSNYRISWSAENASHLARVWRQHVCVTKRWCYTSNFATTCLFRQRITTSILTAFNQIIHQNWTIILFCCFDWSITIWLFDFFLLLQCTLKIFFFFLHFPSIIIYFLNILDPQTNHFQDNYLLLYISLIFASNYNYNSYKLRSLNFDTTVFVHWSIFFMYPRFKNFLGLFCLKIIFESYFIMYV